MLRGNETSKSYAHKCTKKSVDGYYYEISWVTDKMNGRYRVPTRQFRETDEDGAKRFCKKWGIDFSQVKVAG